MSIKAKGYVVAKHRDSEIVSEWIHEAHDVLLRSLESLSSLRHILEYPYGLSQSEHVARFEYELRCFLALFEESLSVRKEALQIFAASWPDPRLVPVLSAVGGNRDAFYGYGSSFHNLIQPLSDRVMDILEELKISDDFDRSTFDNKDWPERSRYFLTQMDYFDRNRFCAYLMREESLALLYVIGNPQVVKEMVEDGSVERQVKRKLTQEEAEEKVREYLKRHGKSLPSRTDIARDTGVPRSSVFKTLSFKTYYKRYSEIKEKNKKGRLGKRITFDAAEREKALKDLERAQREDDNSFRVY